MPAIRKSPAAHARDTPLGTVAKGQDGKQWVVSATKSGVKRWVPVQVAAPGTKRYLVHDNGGRPFMASFDKHKVAVFKSTADDDYDYDRPKTTYTICVLKPTPYVKAFVGGTDGNSLLFFLGYKNMKYLTYLHVGREVYTFVAPTQITKYFSPLGGSDVPYPYAVDVEGASYLMAEHVIVPRELLTTSPDPYDTLYRRGINETRQMKNKKVKEFMRDHAMAIKLIHASLS